MTVYRRLSRRIRQAFVCALAITAVGSFAEAARAEGATQAGAAKRQVAVARPAHWPRPISKWEWAATGALVVAGVGYELFVPLPEQPLLRGAFLFDGGLQGALKQDSERGRSRAVLLGDVLTLAPLSLVVSDLVVAGARGRGRWYELFAIDAQAFALSGIVVRSLQLALPRERPDQAACPTKSDATKEACVVDGNASFPSGHSAVAATAAGLVCSHHRHLSLYGSDVADATVCIAAVGSALGAGAMRVMSDRHYTTDVLAGLAIGGFFGYGLPELWHYRARTADRNQSGTESRFQALLTPVLSRNPGVMLTGSF